MVIISACSCLIWTASSIARPRDISRNKRKRWRHHINTIRSIDIATRYGGDEFIIILPETDEALAIDIAERIRANLEKRLAGSSQVVACREQETITASIGIACYPEHGSTIEHLLKNVDAALYRQKAGRTE
jgi:diguanylate cyclase (GGDEF)-like protein